MSSGFNTENNQEIFKSQGKVKVTDLLSRLNQEKKIEKKRNLALGVAAISAVMIVGWMGSVTNALGYTYELRVIAATVIGGANLMGGVGGTFGAFIGAALMETIRNSLLMAGIDPYWQGTFLGLFIVGAVWLEKVKNKKN